MNNLKTEDLNSEQLAALMGAINEEYDSVAANFMRLVLCTGMRRGEIFKLQWRDVDFDRNLITLREPKGGRDQTIPLNQAARELAGRHPRTPAAFCLSRAGVVGSGPGRLKRIEAIGKLAGLAPGLPAPARPPALLRLHAGLIRPGGPIRHPKLLTHKSAAMTQRYAHLRDDTLRRASDLAGDLIGQARDPGVAP